MRILSLISAMLGFTMLATPAAAQLDAPGSRKTLTGLPGFFVAVEDMDTSAARVGVTSAVIQTDVEARLRAMQGAMQVPLLTRILLFDVYEGDQVGQGRRSLAFSLTYQAPDRTLTDREVNDLHATIVAEIRARFGAEIRGA